ncbi:MAG TPA: dTDP-4-amino-4,6-dideoxygalactose transaminase [Syntrophomonadaceae bacterium]|nr:dTDP-4-amino-4,6-dideoxygalactose transaminase [Syntrophomonadaceae bacterium]
MQIPFYIPFLTGKELDAMKQVLEQGELTGGGRLSREVASALANRLGTRKILFTTSCTSALEMAAILAGIQEGQEVIMPSFTFVSTANAIVLRGARPVFAEIDPETMNMTGETAADKISPFTRAIIPVHYAGLPCEMDQLCSLAFDRRIKIIEDAAHALFAGYKGKAAGTWGNFGCFSFHATKNINCGEGGAIAINDEEAIARAEVMWQKGTDREKFIRREVAFYSWQDIGSSYAPSELLVAFLKAQLDSARQIQQTRQILWETYAAELKPLADKGLFRIQKQNPDAQSAYHIFYILLTDENKRRQVEEYLRGKGIGTAFHYVPLHLSPMGRRLGYKPGDLPITEKTALSLLRLPLYPGLKENAQSYVIDEVKKAMART